MKDFSKTSFVTVEDRDSWWNPLPTRLENVRQSQDTFVNVNSKRTKGILQLTPHPFHRVWNDYSSTVGQYYPNSGGMTNFVCSELGWYDLSSVKAEAYDNCIREFYSSVGGIRSNLVDIYRTRMETAGMVAQRLTQVARAAQAVRRGDWKKASRALGIKEYAPKSKKRRFSSDWLEYAYGWAPLLGDIYELSSGFPDIQLSTKVRGFAKYDLDLWRNGKPSYETRWMHWEGNSFCVCCIEGDVKITDSAIKAAADLGLTNPAATAWEAVPWSFVVDWVLPIGDYIDSFTALSGLEFSRLNVTYTTTQKVQIRAEINPNHGRGSAPSGVQTLREKRRFLMVSPPDMPLPSFTNPFSLSHLTNAFALFRTNVR